MSGSPGRRPEIEQDAHEVAATRKAAAWAAIAAVGQIAFVATHLRGLDVVGYGLLLPPLASLHARSAPHRASGAVLATSAGVATALSALFGTGWQTLFFLGMWWWTAGKMTVETATLPRPFGRFTMALGALALVGALFAAIGSFAALPLGQAALAAWLLGLAWIFLREDT